MSALDGSLGSPPRWLASWQIWLVDLAVAMAMAVAVAVAVVLVAAHGLLPSADLQRLLTVAASASSARFGQLPDTTRLVTYLQDQWDGERRFPWCRSGTVAAFPKPPCGTLASCAARR